MLTRVRRTIQRHHLLVPGETVVVGVSGGPDSLCLLHVLRELSPELSLSLHVAHLNHRMRGEDADADAAFVAALAAGWGLPSAIGTADVPALARTHKLAPEEAARRARYAFLARVAEQVGARTIAVAHNADDQTETVLMHWLRGSGLAGLRGMLPATPLEEMRLEIGSWKLEDGIWRLEVGGWNLENGSRKLETPSPTSNVQPPTSNFRPLILIRPLLDIPRADVEAYCAAHELQPRFDRSNLDTTYYRNRLRHDLLPILESYNVNIRQVLRRSAVVVAADYDLLREQLEVAWKRLVRGESDQAVTFDLDDWRALPPSLQRSTLREAIHRLRRALRNIDFVHVENAVEILADGQTGDQATLPQGLMLTIGYDSFTVAGEDYRALPDLPLLLGDEVLPIALPGRTRLPGTGWTLHAEVLPHAQVPDAALTAARGWRAHLDAAVLGESPVLRVRRSGDRFCPLGMGGRGKRVNEFMINEKIPAAWRDHVPLLVSAGGQVAWVCGWRIDERARVTPATQQVAWLHFERK
jgi:tRNA(Ile)-lysidine synthetase-like protein